jgi:hypothetical protein
MPLLPCTGRNSRQSLLRLLPVQSAAPRLLHNLSHEAFPPSASLFVLKRLLLLLFTAFIYSIGIYLTSKIFVCQALPLSFFAKTSDFPFIYGYFVTNV